MPYYDHAGITLYLGDSREILSRLENDSVHFVCTDPPYALNFNDGNDLASRRENFLMAGAKNDVPRPILNDGPEAHELFADMVRLITPKMKKGAAFVACCAGGGGREGVAFAKKWQDIIEAHMEFHRTLVWYKGMGLGVYYRNSHEFILLGQNDAPRLRWNGGKNQEDVILIPKVIPGAGEHPTQKPVELISKLVYIHSDPGDLVVDPFLGGGTTAEACKLLGRRCIGIELDEQHLEQTARRLMQEVLF